MSFALGALAMLGLGAAFGAQSTRAGDSRALVIATVAMAMLQVTLAWIAMRSPAPLLLALFALAIGASGVSFLRRGSARDVLLVGGSLAGVQAAVPMGGLLAALLVPVLASLPRSPAAAPRQAGVFLLLCFLPLATAAGLAWFTRTGHAGPVAALQIFSAGVLPARHIPSRFIRALIAGAALIVTAPVAAIVRGERRALFPLLTGASVVAASVVAALIGAIHNPAALLAPLAATSLLAVGHGTQPRPTFAAMTCELVLAGIYLAVLPAAWSM